MKPCGLCARQWSLGASVAYDRRAFFIFLFQLVGTALAALVQLPVPGPVIGMGLLLAWLACALKPRPAWMPFMRYFPALFAIIICASRSGRAELPRGVAGIRFVDICYFDPQHPCCLAGRRAELYLGPAAIAPP